jgi:hypothetical protein
LIVISGALPFWSVCGDVFLGGTGEGDGAGLGDGCRLWCLLFGKFAGLVLPASLGDWVKTLLCAEAAGVFGESPSVGKFDLWVRTDTKLSVSAFHAVPVKPVFGDLAGGIGNDLEVEATAVVKPKVRVGAVCLEGRGCGFDGGVVKCLSRTWHREALRFGAPTDCSMVSRTDLYRIVLDERWMEADCEAGGFAGLLGLKLGGHGRETKRRR